ncbi:HAD family phosphatase [Prevotella aurantiaca]
MIKACLFDLDGVVFDTEPLYTEFWGNIFKEFYPTEQDLELKIKGQTLSQIYGHYFAEQPDRQAEITRRLDAYESKMQYHFVDGFTDFVQQLKQNGVKTAIVTSSNKAKMENVYHQHATFKQLFDAVFTAEDFRESKPSPDGYLTAARALGVEPTDCVVFEDSFNGLRSGLAAKARVVGLATTNSVDSIKEFTKEVIPNFVGYKLTEL